MRASKLNASTLPLTAILLLLALILGSCSISGSKGSLDAGKSFLAEGKYRAAYIEAKKVLQHDEKNGQAWLLLARATMMLGDPNSALADLQHARDNGVQESQLVVPTGRLLRVTRQYAKLLKSVSPDKVEDPAARARIQVLRGQAYLGLGQLENAGGAFQAALKIKPKDPQALAELARVAAAGKDMKQANDYLAQALAASPDNPRTWVIKGDLDFANGAFSHAEDAYRKAIDAKNANWLPQNRLYALMRLANAQAQQKQYAQALGTIKTIEKMSPDQPYAHYLRAVVLYMQGHYGQANSELLTVLKAQPQNGQAQFLMGAVNYAQSNYSQAEMYLSNAVGMQQDNVPARKMLALALYSSGRSGQAIATLRAVEPGNPSDAELLAILQKSASFDTARHGLGVDQTRDNSSAAFMSGKNASRTSPLDSSLFRNRPGQQKVSKAVLHQIKLITGFLREKNIDKALGSAAGFAARNPGDSDAHLLYATTLMVAGKRGQARIQYDKTIKLNPKSVAALASLGNLDALEGHYKDASGRFQSVLKLDPDNASAMVALGRIAMLQGEQSTAIHQFRQAIAAAPNAPESYLALMTVYTRTGQFDQALQTAQQLLKAFPDNPASLNALGVAQLNAGKNVEALKTLQQAVHRAPQVSLSRINLARAQIIGKDNKAATENLMKVIKADPGQIMAVNLLAQMKLQQHDLPGAIALAKSLQKNAPERSEGYMLEGDLYMAAKSWKKAAQAYHQGLKVKQERPLVIRYFLARDRGAAKDPEAILKSWLARHPQDDAMRLVLAQYYVGHDQNQLASTQYKMVLKKHPTNISALNNLAWIYTEQHNPEGLVLAKKAYELVPQSPYIADTYGWALVKADKPEKALAILEKAASAAPGTASIQYHLAVAMARTGNNTGARTVLGKLLRSNARFQERDVANKLYIDLKSHSVNGSTRKSK